jgi:pyrroline-5-carboxylate reductase
MPFDAMNRRGLVLLGCGKMGQALLDGWLAGGLAPAAVSVLDPAPSERLQELAAQGLRLNGDLPAAPAACLLAVKPQQMADALPRVAQLAGGDTVFVSIAAGTTLEALEAGLGAPAPIIRAMPNTPAAIGRGITALVGNARADGAALALAETLMAAVGQTVRLDGEAQMDAVTALSGSGPGYVFQMIEALAEAGAAEGLPPDLAMRLAIATVAGAGALAEASDATPAALREAVTSPGGTTQAGLAVLRETGGLPDLMRRAVAAAAGRSRELRGDA